MKIKILNFADVDKVKKRLFIVYKQYKYLNEIFYCCKPKKASYSELMWRIENPKYVYMEQKTGTMIYLKKGYHEVLSDKKFKKEMRLKLTKSAKNKTGESLHAIIKTMKVENGII